jgi:RNA polymerase sigma-70 factor (ECF subfamily)
MPDNGDETDALLARAVQGDDLARQRLLERHRARLKRMVAVRMDRRLAPRLDPSDVVQEALADAARELPDYFTSGKMAFYPWLRQLAWERLVRLHRDHIDTRRRSVNRERAALLPLPDQSAIDLARRLVSSGTSPSGCAIREELQERVRATLKRMAPRDSEVLVLRYLEMLTNAEIAEVLGITEGAVKVRHYRALERFRGLLDDEGPEDSS